MDVEISKIRESELLHLQEIERLTQLTFWGWDSYKTLLGDDDFIYARVARAAQNGRRGPVGFIIARFIEREAEIMKIGVHPDFQNLGIGGRLLEIALDEAGVRGCAYCYLEVRKSNTPAIEFYKSHSFDFFGYRKSYYTSPLEDAYVMRRRLLRG